MAIRCDHQPLLEAETVSRTSYRYLPAAFAFSRRPFRAPCAPWDLALNPPIAVQLLLRC
jgi:hypothetical protein